MPNTGIFWKPAEVRELILAYKNRPVGQSDTAFSAEYSRRHPKWTDNAIRSQISKHKLDKLAGVVSESTYPRYDKPLQMEGDALIITDLELPFHHADFVNRCLDLAQKWKIKNLILGGDMLHFDSLSGWEPNWIDISPNGLTEADERRLREFVNSLPSKHQRGGEELLEKLGRRVDHDGASTELGIARKEIKRLSQQFEHIDAVMGNHEGRFLRTIATAISPEELTRLLEVGDSPKWRIAPYYFSILISGGEKFQVEHPRNTAKFSASRLAGKYQCHIIMGHSHQLNFTFDPSGQYYAIETGHCVDEERLPYAAQRHTTAAAHVLGASIVRGGVPWLLHKRTDWRALSRA